MGAVDPKFGHFNVTYTEKENGHKKVSEVGFAPCENSNLKDFFYCIKNDHKFDIRGDYHSSVHKYLEIQFVPCQEGECANAIE